MSPRSDFEEFFESLNARGVKYLVVGAYALAFHGVPRFTKDLDILVEATSENARAVIESLKDFGLGDLKLSASELTQPDLIVQLGFPPIRIDLLTSIDGVTFPKAWKRKSRGAFGKVEVNYLSKRDLIASKKAAGRPQDLADLESLQQHKRRKQEI